MTLLYAERTGSQTPTFLTRPARAVSSAAGREVVDLAAAVGLFLDEWQQLALEVILSERKSRKWAALEAALILPRQNGKDVVLAAIELADLVLFKNPDRSPRLVIHSAHKFNTAEEHFVYVKGLFEGSDYLMRLTKGIKSGHGDESIAMRSGARLEFLAREHASGRGFTADRVILNEALILSERPIASLIPTMSAKSKLGNPQIIYASSAPFGPDHPDVEKSVVLHRLRKRGRAGDPTLAYIEFCGSSDDPDDIDSWYAANPALGIRMTEEFVQMERSSMADQSFIAERLGLTPDLPDGGIDSVWPDHAWDACCHALAASDVGVVFAVDVHPDRTSAAIGAADAAGRVELLEHRQGVGWVVDRAVELAAKYHRKVAIQATGAAGALIPDLEREKVKVVPVPAGAIRAACGAFYDAVAARAPFIRSDPRLDVAAAVAVKKISGDAWVFDRRAGADITPLYAVVLARWAATPPTKLVPLGAWK